jgi:hypothetical protein
MTEESSDTPLENIIGSEIVSVTFGGFYFVLCGLGKAGQSAQRRWQLRSSCEVGWKNAADVENDWDFEHPRQRCADLVSTINQMLVGAAFNGLGLELIFSSGMSCLLKHDDQIDEVGDLECYLVDSNMNETLEGLWSL